MKNLLWCLIPTMVLTIIFGIAAIIVLIKNVKKYWIISIILCAFLLASLYISYPFIKDCCKKELVTIEGIYSTYTGTDGNWGCVKIGFSEENQEQFVYVSRILFDKYNLEKNHKYKITYYKNSHAVYNIELISE